MMLPDSKMHDMGPACRPNNRQADGDKSRAGKILIVDSDAAIRGLISNSVRHMGHTVTEAESPENAMQLVAGGATFDMVVTEVNLRSTGGIAMARKLLDCGATSSLLFMTESAPLARAMSGSVGNGMFITKPFSADEFKRRIDEGLRRARKDTVVAPHKNVWAKQRLRGIGGRQRRGLWRSSDRRTPGFTHHDHPQGASF
jgi:DNA-binding response OmpR family regulator